MFRINKPSGLKFSRTESRVLSDSNISCKFGSPKTRKKKTTAQIMHTFTMLKTFILPLYKCIQ